MGFSEEWTNGFSPKQEIAFSLILAFFAYGNYLLDYINYLIIVIKLNNNDSEFYN